MSQPQPLRRGIVLALLFLSGATSLVYELVWSKYLSNVLGNSGQAHAVVLATFMGGLALGAYLFGRTADRVLRPLFLYGALELAIGLYALLFRPVLDLLGQAYLTVAPSLPEGGRIVPRLGLAALSLAAPTLLMGGTLPALVRHFTAHLGTMRRELSRLYAVNSLGAAFGVLLAGVQLVPVLGLANASRLAAASNVVLALCAMALSRRDPPARPDPFGALAGEPEPQVTYPLPAIRAALVCVALSGFTALLLEITWIRLLTLVLGGSTYAFTLILAAFIFGIGLGSSWLTTRKLEGDALRLFGWCQVGVVLSVCLALPLYVRLPHLFWVTHHALRRSLEGWPVYQAITFFFCCAVLLPPTFFMGAAFPSAARVATAQVQQLGRQLGGVYLWNTGGTIAGASLGGLWLLPALGLEGNFAVALGASVLAAGLAFIFAPSGAGVRPGRRLLPAAGAGLCAALYLVASWGGSTFLSNSDAFRQREAPFPSFAHYRAVTEKAFHTLFLRDDTFATVLVGEGRNSGHRFMRINGKVDASNASDVETQILAGHLGPLLHPRQVKRVLLIGAGAAVTAGSLLAHDVEQVDLVEISPAVIEGARLFAADNRSALDDPRLKIHLDDAKTFMALAGVKYDLIVSVPSNPWVSGVSGLFSRDFFQLAARHLAPEGLLVQWVHTYESAEPLVQLVVRTLRETFPHATSWLGPQDLLFVASREPLEIAPARIARRMERAEVFEDLSRCDAADVLSLLARQIHDPESLARFAGEGPINTDDLNLLEYAAPVAFFVDKPPFRVADLRRAGATGPTGLALERYLRENPLTPEGAERIHRVLSRYPKGNSELLRAISERWVALAPQQPMAQLAAARAALEQDDYLRTIELIGPRLEAGSRAPEWVIPYLRARTRHLRLSRAAWNPLLPSGRLEADVALAQEARRRAPGHEALGAATDEICTLVAAGCSPEAY